MRVAELMVSAGEALRKAGVDESRSIDIQLLLGHCLRKTRTQLFLSSAENITDIQLEQFNGLLARRVLREPLAYILGEQEFWSMNFKVNPHVLIPRPETEFLLECVLASDGDWRRSDTSILDLCTGSGVISIVLAKELCRKVYAVDISPAAIKVATSNCQLHDVDNLVILCESDLFESLPLEQKCGLIVSNPPYVGRNAVACELEPEVSSYEPHLALDGGDDGLDIIRRIRRDLPRFLVQGGEFFMEFGSDQGLEIRNLFSETGSDTSFFSDIKIFKDYAGRDRVLYARFAGFRR